MLKTFLLKSFSYLLFLILILLIVAIWVLAGKKILELPSEVTGALIVTWTILIQYYFRKKQSESTTG